MTSPVKKRVTMKLRHPNPLFEKWLTDWKNEANAKDSKLQHTFSKALQSLKRYPLPLHSGRECKILKGFGDRLCQMLDEKLQRHTGDCNGNDRCNGSITNKDLSDASTPLKGKTAKKQKESSLKDEYVPKYKSGPYAILVVLFENNLKPDYKGFLTKEEIVSGAKFLCDKSFLNPDEGSYYTAWSSMKTLLGKDLVKKVQKSFALTEKGRILGEKLYRTNLPNKIDQEQGETRSNESLNNQNTPSKTDDIICLDDYDIEKANNADAESTKEMCDLLYKKIIFDNKNDSERNGDKLSSSNAKLKSKVLKNQSKKLKSTESTSFDAQAETAIFAPNTFEIILLIDTAETSGTSQAHDDPIISDLLHLGVNFEIRHLKIGDYAWVCRENQTSFELVLPYIVERKRMDDFGHSIKDGRYHEQKFRLNRCGIQNIIYLVESYGKNEHTGLPMSTLMQAATNTLVQDQFQVKFCESTRATAHYLNCLTKILISNYKMKTVMSCPKKNLENTSIHADLVPLMTFKEFSKSGSKYKTFTVKEMFIRHLLQLKGLSFDKAVAIVENFPTPKLLKAEFKSDPKNAEKVLASIQFGKNKKKIGPVISKAVHDFYSLNDFV